MLIYLLLFAGAIVAYTKFMKFIHSQKLAVEVEKLEKEKIQEVNRHKLNFFTFISHELKTPLTLIIASVEKYFNQKNSSDTQPEELRSVKYNARKLNHLIQQLMEFRKIETDHAKLDLKKGDVILFLKDTFKAFEPLFDYKNITHSFKNNFSEYQCYFDDSKLEMIFTNLVSNAVKYTDNNGSVSVKADITNTLNENRNAVLTITVSDTGRGMPPEQVDKILNTFYRAETGNPQLEGSGVGMALVKSLVDFLGGDIKITSQEGEGSIFTVSIALILKPQPEEITGSIEGNKFIDINPDLMLDNVPAVFNDQVLAGSPSVINNHDVVVFIVEDNVELMKFLSRHFTEKFKVVTAKNGEEALKKMEKTYPDIIISDVKMPVMDGITLCKKIKQNKENAHIPIVLLSARTDETHKMEGLNVGANAYLSKPFNLKELDLLVKNLLENNKSFKSKFSNFPLSTSGKLPETNREIEFVKKITSLIEKHYTEPDFNINILADRAGISRSLLHIKMKKAMHTNASDFIRKVRMDKAVELLEQGKLISEVAYKVGYSDPNYFSRVFKKHFKDSPTNYITKKQKIT